MRRISISLLLIHAFFYTPFNFCLINALRNAARVIPKHVPCVMPQHIRCSVVPQLPSFDIQHDLFEKADHYFENTEGYNKVIRDIERVYAHKPSFLKGFLFELETAVALIERGEAIEALHKDIYDPLSESLKDKREIDILTNSYAVECKCYEWRSFLAKQQEIKKQLMFQKRIIDAHNRYYGTHYNVLLRSKTLIPLWMKQFLDDCSIAYEDPSTLTYGSRSSRFA